MWDGLFPDWLQFDRCSAIGSDISVVYVTTSVIGLSVAQQIRFVVAFMDLHNVWNDVFN